ncbi:hypothetical protein B0H13DRAFT_1855309 [Mycena leptocephala]|nr:hypothetical protein B0H13DRAFT_1855309 [Mycena leptocephala]
MNVYKFCFFGLGISKTTFWAICGTTKSHRSMDGDDTTPVPNLIHEITILLLELPRPECTRFDQDLVNVKDRMPYLNLRPDYSISEVMITVPHNASIYPTPSANGKTATDDETKNALEISESSMIPIGHASLNTSLLGGLLHVLLESPKDAPLDIYSLCFSGKHFGDRANQVRE